MVKRKKTPTEPLDAATAAYRAKAREAGVEAISALLRLVQETKSESVKLAAIKELLDRGFGRVAASEGPGGAVSHLMVDDGYAD